MLFKEKDLIKDKRFLTAELRHKNINDRLEITQERRKEIGEWLSFLHSDVPCSSADTKRGHKTFSSNKQ